MTLLEKRSLLIERIQQMSEEELDKLLATTPSKTENGEQEDERRQEINAIIKNDFKRYHNVFKALS